MSRIKIWCVLVDDKYTIDDVVRLDTMVKRNCSLKYEFYCYTDQSHDRFPEGIKPISIMIPGSYRHFNKYHLLSLGGDGTTNLFFDLDIVIKNPIDQLVIDIEMNSNKILLVDAMWGSWDPNKIQVNSSVMGWTTSSKASNHSFQYFYDNEDEIHLKYRGLDRTFWHELKQYITTFSSDFFYSRLFGIDENHNFWTIKEDQLFDCDKPICLFNGVGGLHKEDFDRLQPYKGFEQFWE